ncbi:DNA primase, partial [Glaesserella parasuis]|nr:DNA primase [Glaesserella parasuis]
MKVFTKLKNAPNMKLQKPNAENAFIIIGYQAWDFAKAPPAERTQGEIALDNVLPQGDKSPPIVLTSEVLKNVHQYRIAPKQAHTITLQRANHGEDVSSEIMAKLCLNLANNTQAKIVHYIDEAEQHIEDLSGYIERIRQGEAMAENVAEVTASDDVNADIDKHQNYIEKRTENGIEGLYRITPYDKDTGELLSERTEWLSDEIAVVGIGQSEAEHYLVLEWTPEGKSQPVKEALSLGDLGEREGWRQLKAKGLRLTTRT